MTTQPRIQDRIIEIHEDRSVSRAGGGGRLATAARIVLGLIFTLSGVNHCLSLVPMPAMAGSTAVFYEGLRQTGYFFPLLGSAEVAAGLMLLSGRAVKLALVLVAPIAVNMAVFHAVLAPEGLGIAAVTCAAAIVLARRSWPGLRGLFAARAPRVGAGFRVVEVVLGAAFVASGIAGLLGRTPPPSTAGAAIMMRGLEASGYFLPALCAVQIGAGGLLIARRFAGLALLVLAPIVVEIVAYRLFVSAAAPRMLVVAALIVVAEMALGFAHRATFRPLWPLARA